MPSVSNPTSSSNNNTNGFNKTSLEAKKQQAKQLFQEIDLDGNGTLSKDELFTALRKLHLPTSKSTFEKFFAEMDLDHNQVIDKDEFENFVVHRYQLLEEAFDHLLIYQQQQQQIRSSSPSPTSTRRFSLSQVTSFFSSSSLARDSFSLPSPVAKKSASDTTGTTIARQDSISCSSSLSRSPSPTSTSPSTPSPSPLTGIIPTFQNQPQQQPPSSPSFLDRTTLTADCFRRAALHSGVILSDADLRNIMDHMDTTHDDRVSFNEFVNYMLLCPCEVNPNAFFDSWYTDAFVDDGQSEYTFPREIRSLPSGGFFLMGGTVEEAPGVSSSTTTSAAAENQQEGKSTAKKEESMLSTSTSATPETTPNCNLQEQRPTFLQLVAKKLLFGGISGLLSRTLTAPVDRVRILMITSIDRMTIAEACRKSIEGGPRSLWRGNATNCVKITPEMAIKLFTFDTLKKAFSRDHSNITFTERLVSGAIAGLVSQGTVYPLEVIRTRMATSVKPYRSIWDCVKTTYLSSATAASNPTLRVFYAGILPSVCGIVPYAGIDLSLNSYLRDRSADYLKSQNREVSVPLLLSCGMVSSSVATVCTFPLNVLKTKAQASGRNPVEILKEILSHVDSVTGAKPSAFVVMRRLYAGMLPALSKVAPATSISYASYDFLGRTWK